MPEAAATCLEHRPRGRHDDLAPSPAESAVIDMRDIVGRMSVLFVTLDCLRLDVARRALADGRTPNLAGVLPPHRWEPRETPGTFTLPAHQAFFHGFLPTP